MSGNGRRRMARVRTNRWALLGVALFAACASPPRVAGYVALEGKGFG
jgi:hypothetical protein